MIYGTRPSTTVVLMVRVRVLGSGIGVRGVGGVGARLIGVGRGAGRVFGSR